LIVRITTYNKERFMNDAKYIGPDVFGRCENWCARLPDEPLREEICAPGRPSDLLKPPASCREPAPAPRRFAQGMVATFMLLIGISLLQRRSTIAWIGEALIVVALLDLFLRRFCLGSAVFNLIHRSNTSAKAEETHPT
jgi:Domain of unknown function (DUF4395)